jgi:hypothetical protein
MTPDRGMDKSSQRPRRAEAEAVAEAAAEAVACPLGAQPGINRHCRLLLQICQLLGYAATKLRPPLGAMAVSQPWDEDNAVVPE